MSDKAFGIVVAIVALTVGATIVAGIAIGNWRSLRGQEIRARIISTCIENGGHPLLRTENEHFISCTR